MSCIDAMNNGCSKSFVAVNLIGHENGTNQFVQFFYSGSGFNLPAANADVLPVNCLITNLCLQVDWTPIAGKTIQAWIAVNGVVTPMTVIVNNVTGNTIFYPGADIIALAGSTVNFVYNITSGSGTQNIRMSALLKM